MWLGLLVDVAIPRPPAFPANPPPFVVVLRGVGAVRGAVLSLCARVDPRLDPDSPYYSESDSGAPVVAQ